MRVIVVGGGTGGLSAAIALRNAGHEVVVLERAPRLDPVGAGITLFGNAMDGLGTLGVAEAVREAGAAASHSTIRRSHGSELARLPPELLAGAVAVHRGELQRVLVEAAGEIRVAAEVVSVRQTSDEVVAVIGDGTEVGGDLLVGADGLWSQVRAAVVPSAPRYGGYTAWRGVSTAQIEPGHLTESWGVGERFGIVDIGSRTYWFATANAAEGEIEAPWERKPALLRRFAGWQNSIARVLESTPDDGILRHDVYFLEPIPRWSEGRTVLLGDAAHALTPGIGQGAAQAIEDAVVLANELNDGRDVAEALRRYEAIRRPRAELALRLSRRADRAAQLTSPLGRWLRDIAVRSTPARVQRGQLALLIDSKLA